MIRARSLTVRYAGSPRPALDRLDLDVQPGRLHGLIGSNGAGKTTTLRVLAGLLRPTDGAVSVAGVDVAARPAGVRGRVGFLPDGFGVAGDLTCAELLDFHVSARGERRPRRRALVAQALEITDLSEVSDVLASALSRGMRQRLGLARVLVTEPDVLLLDEPASGLDPRARVELREILRELAAMQKTVLLSSHVLSDIAATCDAITVLADGSASFSGAPGDVHGARRRESVVIRCMAREGLAATRRALEVDDALSRPRGLVEQDGVLRVRVRVSARESSSRSDEDLAAAHVAKRLIDDGLTPVHLSSERSDLESAFLALTTGDRRS